jgi:hypothetical protein
MANQEIYTIYEVVGYKIGCTENLKDRIRQMCKKYGVSKDEFIILEEHTDIYLASEREQQLQADKGYKVDKQPYWYVRQVQLPKAMDPKIRKEKVYDKVNGSRRKPVEAFKDGISVGKFISHWQAADKLNLNHTYISAVVNPKKPHIKSTGGYTFKSLSQNDWKVGISK